MKQLLFGIHLPVMGFSSDSSISIGNYSDSNNIITYSKDCNACNCCLSISSTCSNDGITKGSDKFNSYIINLRGAIIFILEHKS